MTPEEKFNTAMQWTLRAVKEQQLLTPKSENIKLDVRRLTNIESNSPRMDVIAGCIRKLEEWNVLKVVDKYDQFGFESYYENTDWDMANTFEFILYQQKFDELYQSYETQHRAEGGHLEVSEPPQNNIQILADQLNKDFADDKQNIQISRAWFEALANGAKPADGKTELEGFQTMVAQTLINLEPFRRRLAENAKVINQISQNLIMPNLEAVKPMLKEIEDSLGRVSRYYNPPQNLTITAPLSPKISETIENGEIMKEIRALRNEVKRLTDIKAPTASQESAKGNSEIQEQDKRPFCVIEGKWGFLKFNKQGQKVKIGTANSQSFKLLKSLTEPFGIAKSVDVVFEAIREGVKYKSKSGVYTSGIDKLQKIKLIEYAIKELQKGDKLQGKLAFKWDDMKAKIWLHYLG